MNRDGVSDDRAVSPLIGAILLLAILMTMLALLQLNAVPALVSEAEFDHNQRVQGEMRDLAAGIDRSVTTGTSQSIILTPGVRYQSRMFLLNPPPATGTVRAGEPKTVTIENATAPGETGDYWNGSPKPIETRSLIYTPDYNEYHDAPQTVYDLGTVYNRVGETTLVTDGHQLVNGRTISLTALRGEVSHTSVDRTLLEVRPSSTGTRTVSVSGTESKPLTLSIPTELTKNQWKDILKNDGHVAEYECSATEQADEPCGTLTITLERNVTYEMQLSRVSVGDDSNTWTETYLTDIEGSNASVPAGGRQRLVTEVRDEFDNPVSGVSIEADVSSGPGTVTPTVSASGTDGRTAFVYEAPETVSGVQNITVEAAFGDSNRERVAFELQVWGEPADNPGQGNGGNPGQGNGTGNR
ncbi:archaellin/type IV pilin N-terminal domain-containing protein [Haloarchaeobius amylolyticus]|uniref:Archaellin/type IV pilin N-terminal domain-containing protein n=1 Tax=Haloarchaeobius amylolyticus TaxID=1198296 RepID=A0ABD6BEC1_9EURY